MFLLCGWTFAITTEKVSGYLELNQMMVAEAGGNGEVQAVWKREANIYTATQGMPEKEIGEGRGCTIETVNNKNVYAWTESGKVVFIKPGGLKEVIGDGSLPVLQAIDGHHVMCVWENGKISLVFSYNNIWSDYVNNILTNINQTNPLKKFIHLQG